MVEGQPAKDVDLMAAGIDFPALGGIVRSLPRGALGIRRIVAAGKRFAVYRVAASWSAHAIDIAPARGEAPGGRDAHGSAAGTAARGDAARRDITINSFMVSSRSRGGRLTGEVQDFFGGMEDLRRGRIRAVGNPHDRIREDPLRMVRAIRQKQERPGSVIEKRTWTAIRSEAARIGSVPGDRLAGELRRSLSADPSGTVADLYRAGLLQRLLPEIRPWGRGPLDRIRKRYDLLEASLGRPLPEPLLFAGLFVDVAQREARVVPEGRRRGRRPTGSAGRKAHDKEAVPLPATIAAARRLRIPGLRGVIRMLEDLCRLSRLPKVRNPNARLEAVFARWTDPNLLLALYEAAHAAASRKSDDLRPLLAAAADRPPLLSGDDVLALGVPAGPDVEAVLERVREATLVGEVAERDAAVRLATSIAADRRCPAALRRTRR